MSAMILAAKKAGVTLVPADCYRDYSGQVYWRTWWCNVGKCANAAIPGTSNHGLGLAVDLCGGVERFGSPGFLWMKSNAGRFGFVHPGWAEPGGSKPEPWHWEFAG
jgi:LAS superfamily LD-carboxypeptidase LdcB